MSQRDQILSYLKTGRQLTPLQALDRFGCFRLAARIDELREDGHRIHTTMIEVGNDKRVGSYLLIPRRRKAA
jgi:hypothetical protein